MNNPIELEKEKKALNELFKKIIRRIKEFFLRISEKISEFNSYSSLKKKKNSTVYSNEDEDSVHAIIEEYSPFLDSF